MHSKIKVDFANLWKFILHVGKDEQKPSDCIPQPTVSQSKLVALTRTLQAWQKHTYNTSE